jgi:hypothetical protein
MVMTAGAIFESVLTIDRSVSRNVMNDSMSSC